MDVVGAIIDGRIDAGVGIGCINGTELEAYCEVRRKTRTN